MFSLHGDIFLKIPLDMAVNKYLGFTPMNSWESALPYANTKYLFTGYQPGRYHREEITLPDNSSSGRANFSLPPRRAGIFDRPIEDPGMRERAGI